MRYRPCIGTAIIRGVLLLLVLALLTTTAMAQGVTTAIRGTVMDQQGSVIPNANVTLTSAATNAVRTQKTSPTGAFDFELLPPGDYRLEVGASGFKSVTELVHALIARPTEFEVRLQVGAASETVTVSAESTMVQVNTQDSSVGNNFIASQITELPLEAKNVMNLLTLQPGVTKDGYVAGARSDQSNVTLDGVNINDAQTSRLEDTVLRLNSEAVEEFRVNTMTNSASAGRSAGAQINLVTKSGSNRFRGSLFDYNRNTIFTANNWFSNHDGIARQALLRDTFGGTLGGPIKKDKFFFFYSYEGRRDRSNEPTDPQYVVLPGLAAGNVTFRNSAGGITVLTPSQIATIFPDTGGENPDAIAALKYGSRFASNSSAVGDGFNTGGFVFNSAAGVKLNSHVARFDYNISQRQTLFARVNVIHDHDASKVATGFTQYFPDSKHPSLWSHPWGIAASHTWTIGNNLVNSATYGLTRQAFTSIGDTEGNWTYLRLVYYPSNGTYDLKRTTPVHTLTDDLSWVKGSHTFHFGGTVTLITNNRINYGNAFDTAYANPSGYKTNLIANSINQYLMETYGYKIGPGMQSPVENAITNVLGRYNNYTSRFTFAHDGSLQPVGTPSNRSFATQGYEGYAQDTWKVSPNLTVTYGLRYSLWRPVYERNGYETQPNIPLGEYFKRRAAGAYNGTPYLDLITINKSGPANGGPPLYNWDKKVFLPKIAVAWSPRTENGFLSRVFGRNGESVVRGGFALINDYMGPAIATFFDRVNTLGYVQSQVIPVNTFNVGCGHYVEVGNKLSSCKPVLGPLFTGFGQTGVRSFPFVVAPSTLTFPQTKPAVARPTGIESSLDSQLQTPKNYAWSLTFERELPHGALLQFSYLGRAARHLLAQRDPMTPAPLRDPKSGMDWYTAATILEKARQADVDPSYFNTHPIAYFENLFPGLADYWEYPAGTTQTYAVYDDAYSYNANDWTTTMYDLERRSNVGPHAFYAPQWAALDTWSTIGNSNYDALAVSFRERIKDLTVDVNYTWAHSRDDASGLQSNGTWSESALILNPFRQGDNYQSSSFDMRHVINVNSVWGLPVGKGKTFLGDANSVVDGILGGWQLSNIFRWNTGIPLDAPFDAAQWVTNWEVQSFVTPKSPMPRGGCPTRVVATPQFFGNCLTQAYQTFRPGYPGDTGARSYFNYPNYIVWDFGLSKTWKLPGREGTSLQFRWETFNATNTQAFFDLDYSRTGWGIQPYNGSEPSPNFSNFTSIQGDRRVMQFALVFRF